MPLNIRIQWNARAACLSECVLKTLACRGLRVGPSKFRVMTSVTPKISCLGNEKALYGAIHGPMPVQGETLVHTNFPRKGYGPIIGPYEFPQELVWTNGARSSLKVSVLTGIGLWSALPCNFVMISASTVLVRGPHVWPLQPSFQRDPVRVRKVDRCS